MIEIDSLSKYYGNYQVLDKLSCNMRCGEIIGVIGKNGVGKTTFLKCILGLVGIDEGKIIFGGTDEVKSGKGIPNYVTGMIESPSLYENMSGMKNIEMYASLYGKIDKKRIHKIVTQLELQSCIKKRAKTYSLGTKQKIYLAMLFSVNAEIYILDEPMNALDPIMVNLFRRIIVELAKNENKTIILSSHNLFECEKLCDRYIFMKEEGKYEIFKEKDVYSTILNCWQLVLAGRKNELIFELEQCGGVAKYREDKRCIEVEKIERKTLLDILKKYRFLELKQKTETLEDFFLKWEMEDVKK